IPVRRAVHRTDQSPRGGLGPAVGRVPRRAGRHGQRRPEDMTHPRAALIVGGGIAGPAAAIALQKAGIDSVIYVAHSRSAEGIGSFLTLGSNGIDALRTLGAEEAVLAAGFPTPYIKLRGNTGKHLGVSRISS